MCHDGRLGSGHNSKKEDESAEAGRRDAAAQNGSQTEMSERQLRQKEEAKKPAPAGPWQQQDEPEQQTAGASAAGFPSAPG